MKKKVKKLGIETSLSGKQTVNKESPLPPKRVPIFPRELLVFKDSITSHNIYVHCEKGIIHLLIIEIHI